jgi:hypothetical protein
MGDPFAAGASLAARSLGYRGLADLIAGDHLGPEQIARLFANSASKNGAQDLTISITAGSIARYRASPNGWTGEIERQLAQRAMTRQGAALDFERLSGRAAALVKKSWAEIERLADSP